MMKKALLALVGLLAMGSVAVAAERNAYLYVYANVIPYCYMYTSALDFGDYEGYYVSSTGAVNVACNTAGLTYDITLDDGSYPDAGYHRLYSGSTGEYLYYYVANPAFSDYWGDAGYDGTTALGGPVAGSATGGFTYDSYTVNGWINGGQGAAAGSYYDYIWVSVYY